MDHQVCLFVFCFIFNTLHRQLDLSFHERITITDSEKDSAFNASRATCLVPSKRESSRSEVQGNLRFSGARPRVKQSCLLPCCVLQPWTLPAGLGPPSTEPNPSFLLSTTLLFLNPLPGRPNPHWTIRALSCLEHGGNQSSETCQGSRQLETDLRRLFGRKKKSIYRKEQSNKLPFILCVYIIYCVYVAYIYTVYMHIYIYFFFENLELESKKTFILWESRKKKCSAMQADQYKLCCWGKC